MSIRCCERGPARSSLTAFLSQFGPGKSTLDVGLQDVGYDLANPFGCRARGDRMWTHVPKNVAEAKRRNPHLDFRVGNAEDVVLRRIGRFDIVVCFGLMLRVLEESSKGDSKGIILHMGDNPLTLEAVPLLEEYGALRKGTSQHTITISGYDYYQKLKTPRVYWAKKRIGFL